MNLMLKYLRMSRELTRKKRVAYRIYSEKLEAYLWVVADENDIEALRPLSNIGEPIYTNDEIQKLKGMDMNTEGLRTIQEIKTTFKEGKVIDQEEKQ